MANSVSHTNPTTIVTNATTFKVIASIKQIMLLENKENHKRFLATPYYPNNESKELQLLPSSEEELAVKEIKYLGKIKSNLELAPDFYQVELYNNDYCSLTCNLVRIL